MLSMLRYKPCRVALTKLSALPQKRFLRKTSTFQTELPIANPANGQIITTVKTDTSDSIDKKFLDASSELPKWKNIPFSQKKEAVAKFGELLKDNIDDLAKTLTSEMGKPVSQAKGEIKGTLARLQFFMDNTESVLKPRVVREQPKLREEVRNEPLGVVANISAWNYPYFVGVNAFIPALLTGNVVLYKPSEYSTLTGLKITEMLHKSGIPEKAFIPVIGKGDVGEILLSKNLNGVFFTGSNATGAKIAQKVGNRMIKLQLELGGKDPSYVCEDTDVEFAAKSLADGAMYNTGQSCCSVERIYVHSKVYKQFVDIFVNEVKGFKPADPLQDGAYIGPLTMAKQVEVLEKQVKDAVNKGAKVLVGGKKINQSGNWFEPTVIVNVNHKMEVMWEESFGPIIGIMEVKNDEEAIKLMNDTKYGLTAGVYTQNQQRAETLLSQINSGSVYWNACDRVSPFLPWSGRKGSGVGSTLGLEGIQAFVQPKAYHFITH